MLLFLFFLHKKLYRSTYIFLLIYLGVMILQVTLKVMNKIWLMDNWHPLYSLSFYLPLLYGPLVYFFAGQLFLNNKFRPLQILHFFPFAVFLIYFAFVRPIGFEVSFLEPVLSIYGMLVMELLSLVVYHLLSIYSLNGYDKTNKILSGIQRQQIKWVKQFVYVSFFVCAAISFFIYQLYINYPYGHEWRYVFVALTLFIYWISYNALTKPAIFSVIKGYAGEGHIETFIPKLLVHRPAKKYVHSALSNEEVIRIASSLNKIMKEQRPFLDPGFTINDLATLLNCSRHHLSQVLNGRLNQSFYDYINQYKVEEAKLLLLHPSRDNHKVSSIAYDAGFNSLSTFNDVFKKLTGQTPSEFKKNSVEISQKKRV